MNFKIKPPTGLEASKLRYIIADEPITTRNFNMGIPGVVFKKDVDRYTILVEVGDFFSPNEVCQKLIKTYQK